jgi:hypothetical protein
MMKKIIIVAVCMGIFITSTNAQKEEEEDTKKPFFKLENLFTGGSVGGGFGQGTFSVGVGPHVGYSVNKYIDVALSLNYNYVSQRDYEVYGDKVRQSIIGPGAFVRLFPVNFLYAQAQIERNFVTLKYFPANNSYISKQQLSFAATSYLVGAGYANGREGVNGSYYYFSVLFDIGKDINSPYIDQLGRIDPLIRAGFNIALFQGGGRSGYKKSKDDY